MSVIDGNCKSKMFFILESSFFEWGGVIFKFYFQSNNITSRKIPIMLSFVLHLVHSIFSLQRGNSCEGCIWFLKSHPFFLLLNVSSSVISCQNTVFR